MKLYNEKQEFGWCGPFEATSKEALADEMLPTLTDWAKELQSQQEEDPTPLDEIVAGLRAEFIDGLTEV